ncbi:MAG TPA: chromosome segregation protein SMC [Candidatus Syntrophoarchaeum butanivorans]|uniref:Chromosome partition protein Smc n=1 Tax=Candidatus Syntropharchaeum butanivorans TaxID=1839936 RepID=A0A1F2P5Y9_9EURY|nr:MAG: Chromosome segregation protein SMC [Candidatus Syntrophoarchaeum butanivorans]HEC56280.1 chromosome segregation protein SMC [Candidatus Syntrophoarchaeum butanivorans]
MDVYIKGIYLKNFKSFKDETHIPLFDEFIVISGPNGSGKSNVVDAILFTLGLSSSRDMRAERLTDLIYNSGNGDGLDHAEVSVHFENHDRTIPLDRDVVTISRRIKKTDKGYYSYYYLDGRPCSLSEIQDLLTRSSVTPNSYNVIMQGDVTRILNMSPIERRKIIDEISGVAEFDEKKEKAFEELEEVRRKIDRLDIILEELFNRSKRLEKERDRALEYEKLRNERRRCEAQLLLATLITKERELNDIQSSIDERLEKLKLISGSISEKTAEMEELQSELDEYEVQVIQKQEREWLDVKKEIERVVESINQHKMIIELKKERINDLKAQKSKILGELNSTRSGLEKILNHLDEVRMRREELKYLLDDKLAVLERIKDEIESTDSRIKDARERLFTLRDELERELRVKNELLMEQEMLFERVRRRSDELNLISDQIKGLEDQLDEKRKEVVDGSRRMKELSQELEENENRIKFERSRLSETEDAIRALERKIMEIEAQIRAEKEFKGYSEGVRCIMEGVRSHQLEGVYGTIAELGEVDERFAVALEAAAGGKMQYLVVDTDLDAQHAIEHLKRMKKGRATFLPLNKLKDGVLPPLPKEKGVIGFAINLIRYDPIFRRAFWHVFRDTLVVDSIEDGRRLMDRFRSVTLDGDIIEKSGVMTGGAPPRPRFRFTSSLEDGLLKLREEVAVLESRRRECLEKMRALENQSRSLKDEIFRLGSVTNRAQVEMREVERLLNEARSRLENLDEKGEKERISQLERAISQSTGKISELEREIEDLESGLRISRISELSKREREISEEIRIIESKIQELDLSLKSTTLEQEHLERQITEGEERLRELDGSISHEMDEIEENESRIEVLESELSAMHEREKALEEEISNLKSGFKEGFERVMLLREEIEGLKLRRERIDGAISDLKRIKEGISSEISSLRERIDEIDLSLDETSIEDPDTIRRRIREIEEEMHLLEPVNMRAIDEFREVESRSREMMRRRKTLSKEREEIIDRIEGYERRKCEVFLATFDAINQNFKEVFRELSDGEGELILESPDNPFEGGMLIKVQPAGKPFQRLEALSGGEKSLTALALLFAIQRYRPAPFYVLDEVDMMLDGANVEKVARMIRKLSNGTQFIVVSLREPMIEYASRTIGVVMQEKNISTITGIKLNGRDSQVRTST